MKVIEGMLTAAVDAALAKFDDLLSAIALSTAPPFGPSPNPSVWASQASLLNVTRHPAISASVGLGYGEDAHRSTGCGR